MSILRAKTVIAAVVLVACGGGQLPTEVVTTPAPPATTTTSDGAAASTFPSCSEIPQIYAPEEAYGDTPMYFANEMPTEEVREWAQAQPGFESMWIDREHNGWITVAFSEDAVARQADLERLYPRVGVVAVQVDWDVSELLALQDRVTRELRGVAKSFATWTEEAKGVVTVRLGMVPQEDLVAFAERFRAEPICLEIPDPETLPIPGPQQPIGDGWRLLIDRVDVGYSYRTGIAFDDDSLEALWETIGLHDPLPVVDFNDEVVIWFGAVFGGSCPNLRLDDVIVDKSLVHALIVQPDRPVMCTLDANRRAFVVAVERAKLPEGPFMIQLSAHDPPRGAPEERTVVGADLSEPGSVVAPDQVGPDPNFPPPFALKSGDFLEPGDLAQPYVLDVSCGIEWLGELNSYRWRTEEPMPPAWEDLVENGKLRVEVSLILGDDPVIEATAGGVTVTYRPTNDTLPTC